MSEVNLQLVRECFELNGFHVQTNWRHGARGRRFSGDGSHLYAVNPAPRTAPHPLGLLLYPADLPLIASALVEVRAWHGERFYPSVIENNPNITAFAAPSAMEEARARHGGAATVSILVISALPAASTARARAIQLLQAAGVGHVMEFSYILQDVLSHVDSEGHYTGSQTLQTLRLLKRYRLIRNQQLEFPFAGEPVPPAEEPPVDASVPVDEEDAE